MLKKVKAQDYTQDYAYAPHVVEMLLNTDDIVSIQPTDARGSGPWLRVSMRNGKWFNVEGTIADFATPTPGGK